MADDSTVTGTTAPAVTGGSIADKLTGKVKEVAGSVIGDDQLATEGRLQTAKADAADEALELAQAAEAREAKAELAAREQRLQAEQAALTAQARIEAQTQVVEAEAAADAAKVERDASSRKASAERTRKQRESAAERELFAAAGERAEAEKEADALSAQARQEAARPLTPPVAAPIGIRGLPGRALVGYLDVLQRPITALATTAGKGEAWPPMLAVASLRAKIERAAATVLRDAALRNTGERASAKVQQLQVAAGLESRAAATRAQADRALTSAKSQTAASKNAAKEAAEEQLSAIDGDTARARRATAASKASAKTRVAETAAVNAKAREVADRDRSAAALNKEADALRAERRAMGKQDDVIRLDQAVDRSKAERTRR